jgi:mono/diheme cytochrome c family protein
VTQTQTVYPALSLATDVQDEVLPLSNATLAVSEDGATVVLTDADRNRIHLVQSVAPFTRRTIELEPHDAPGRVAVGLGRAFVSSRRKPVVFEVALDSGEVARHAVCGSPQGLAIDGQGLLQVACRDGTLLALDPASGATVRTLHLDDDLRDVVPLGAGLVVSRFRTAELLQLDEAGNLVSRVRPARGSTAEPAVAWRTVALPDGRLLMAHQLMSTSLLTAANGGVPAYYGGGCGSIAGVTLSVIDLAAPELEVPNLEDPGARYTVLRTGLTSVAGTIDVATPDGVSFYVTAPGSTLEDGLSARVSSASESSTTGSVLLPSATLSDSSLVRVGIEKLTQGCTPGDWVASAGTAVSVAFTPDGRRVVQRREPDEVEIEGGGAVSLGGAPLKNAGLALFQVATSRVIACASCHPEGREDGHTWAFGDVGFRRTPSLEGGVTATAPFHWAGELPTLHALLDEVMVRRMGFLVSFSDAQIVRLGEFMDALPAPTGAYAVDGAARERGRVLFESSATECSGCHSGPYFTDNALHDVGTGGELVTPPLVGIASRAPFMHDGCADTLRERFGVCGGTDHGRTDQLSDAELDDLIAYLTSL